METIRQLSLSDISPDELAPGLEAERRDRSRERMYAAQKRYRQTERGKAKARNNVRAWRERQGAEYRDWNRVRMRNAMREKLYGITIDQFEARLAAQGGVCAICRGLPAPGRQFHVDHDHTTGAIRGILCQKCNGGLGCFW